MLTFKVLSILLNYPESESYAALGEMAVVLEQEQLFASATQQSLLCLINHLRAQALLDLQEQYVALFDRGRFLSLHIFEHVHGESRERGQAMVNLLEMYEAHGFELASKELPDFIPLFLEFLAQLEASEARLLLQDAMPVLALLGARLTERGSHYVAIFDALANFAGSPENLEQIQQQVASEGEDHTLVDMDAIWEEEAVSFMTSGDACQTQNVTINPVAILPREQFVAQAGKTLPL